MNFVPKYRNNTYPFIDPTKADLSGKHVLITGASKGIGKAAAMSYAKAGASGIALAARSTLDGVVKAVKDAARYASRPEPKILAINLDVTDKKSVEATANQVSQEFDGRLDILINNAGYLSSWVPIPETDPDDWWRDWEVNVKGVYLFTRYFFPLLLNSQLKIILNTSSIGAHTYSLNSSAYSSTKLAVLRFTEFIHQDHGPDTKDSVLVIGVHPGGIRTDLSMGLPEHLHVHFTDEPELPGDTLVWLGREKRDWLGGRYISVNWDMEEFETRKEDVVRGDLLKVRMAVNLFPK